MTEIGRDYNLMGVQTLRPARQLLIMRHAAAAVIFISLVFSVSAEGELVEDNMDTVLEGERC